MSRFRIIPGVILAAYLVNMAVPSQTSTAAALGPIVVPLLLAGGFAPDVAGAGLPYATGRATGAAALAGARAAGTVAAGAGAVVRRGYGAARAAAYKLAA